MKNILKLLALVLFASTSVFADSAIDNLEKYVKSKDFLEAAKYISAAVAEKPKDEDIYVLAGDVYTELMKTDSAVIMYKKAYELENGDLKIIYKLANAYSENKNHEEAIELMKKADKNNKNNVDVQLALAQALIKGNNKKDADMIVRRIIKADTTNAKAYMVLADLYFADEIYELAIDNYNNALKFDSKNINAKVNMAISLYYKARREEDKDLKNQYYGQSLALWEQVASDDPKNSRALWEAGKINYYSQLWVDAAKYLNKYIQLRPDHSLARYYLVEALYNINKCEELQQNAEIVIKEIDSVKVRVKTWQAECLYKTAKYPESIAQYKDLANYTKLNGEQYESISKAYLYSGDTVNAINSYSDVIKVDPKRAFSLTAFGTMAFSRKDYANAILILQTREDNIADSNSKKMRYYLGLSYLFGEKHLEASKTFEKVISNDPTNYNAMVYLADCYTKLGAKDSAKTTLVNAIAAMTPNAAKNETTLNNAYQKICSSLMQDKNDKSYKEMTTYAKAWTEALPNSQYAFFFYAISYHVQGEADEACKLYRKAFNIDPKSDFAIKNIKPQMDKACSAGK